MEFAPEECGFWGCEARFGWSRVVVDLGVGQAGEHWSSLDNLPLFPFRFFHSKKLSLTEDPGKFILRTSFITGVILKQLRD